MVPAPSPLDVGSREIPKDGVRGQSRERSAECGRRRTPKGPAKARGPGPGRRDGGGGAKGAADAGADGPRAWGSCPAPYQARAILRGEPATAGPAARAFPVGQGAAEGLAVGGMAESHPRPGKMGHREKASETSRNVLGSTWDLGKGHRPTPQPPLNGGGLVWTPHLPRATSRSSSERLFSHLEMETYS